MRKNLILTALQALVLTVIVSVVSGCITNGASKKVSSKKIPGTAGIPAGLGGDKTASFYLGGMQVSATDPASDFEIFGTQGDILGKYCIGVNDESTCRCEFSGDGFEVQSSPTYVESNMIRCPYTVIPPDQMETVEVRVFVTTTQAYSNALAYNFGTSGTEALDLTSSTSFTPVVRYQCRDIITIPNLFDPAVYDPIQSESTLLAYPLDFYTSNLGKSILGLARESGTNDHYSRWECNFNWGQRPYWSAYRIYSAGPLTAAGDIQVYGNNRETPLHVYPSNEVTKPSVISDPLGFHAMLGQTPAQFNRLTFHLAKKKTGVFNVAVNALIAPGVLTVAPDSNGQQPEGKSPPLGWAAHAIPEGDGEKCPGPDQVTIPTDYYWVKLFLWKATLGQRTYVKTTRATTGMGQLACNYGNFSSTGAFAPLFDECAPAASNVVGSVCESATSSWANYASALPTANQLAADVCDSQVSPDFILTEHSLYWVSQNPAADRLATRVAVGGNFGPSNVNACFRFATNWLVGSGGDAGNDVSPLTGYDRMRMLDKDNGIPTGDSAAPFLYSDAGSNTIPWSEPLTTSGTANYTVGMVEADNPFSFWGATQERFDYLYTVAPESIHYKDLEGGELDADDAAKAFIPFRYKQAANCTGDGVCNDMTNFKLTYEPIDKEVQGSDIISNSKVYPLCVLQKKDW